MLFRSKKKINKLNSKRVKSVNRNIKFALYMLIISLLRVARKVSSGGDIRDVVPTIVFGFLVGFLCLVGLGYALEYFSKRKIDNSDDSKLH